ncbi:hypothetical protein [Methylobacterium sp. WL116]|uniref:hypothetical protein n=1 Tax=Methylobacterium sp. WL116 TaxID=2603889 RepID=UPI0011C92EB3|nr:hypothetical protein [Methylobacterium sp. WL116]TXM95382.1 hypothetical protein FV223_01110 [Methylobacterium sp. WL116]
MNTLSYNPNDFCLDLNEGLDTVELLAGDSVSRLHAEAAIRAEAATLKPNMSLDQIAAVENLCLRAAALLMTDMGAMIRRGNRFGLKLLIRTVMSPKAGRLGELAVEAYDRAYGGRNPVKRAMSADHMAAVTRVLLRNGRAYTGGGRCALADRAIELIH